MLFPKLRHLLFYQINQEPSTSGNSTNIEGSVRMKGLEPPRLSAPDPKSGTATNYATSACSIQSFRTLGSGVKLPPDPKSVPSTRDTNYATSACGLLPNLLFHGRGADNATFPFNRLQGYRLPAFRSRPPNLKFRPFRKRRGKFMEYSQIRNSLLVLY